MDASPLFSMAPTFPMDDVRIGDRSRETMLRSPKTWLPPLAAGAMGVALDAGVAGFVSICAVVCRDSARS